MPPFGSDNPRDLWKWMAAYEEKTGGDVLAIAHNGNLCNGRMFPIIESFTGKPIDREYAETRAKWERLYEATQIKGDGETHPFLSPNDEFANFERWDKGNLDLSESKKPEMLQYEYARSALKLRAQAGRRTRRQSLQVRHDRLDRRAYRSRHRRGGQFLRQDVAARSRAPTRSRSILRQDARKPYDHGLGDVGLRLCGRLGDREHARGDLRRHGAARDLRHHRAAHARALLRRLGFRPPPTPRPAARPWSATPGACRWAATSDRPRRQGADLPGRGAERPDRRQSRPLPDRQGLGRCKGELQEKVYDVAWSGDRKPGADGKLPPVGNTVDVANANWTNTIGAPELIAVWNDPGFRSRSARLLLRARARNPDAALDRV